MYGIMNDPNAPCDISIEETVEWCRAEMKRHGMTKIIVSRDWARRLEIEGFDMSLVEVAEPFGVKPRRKFTGSKESKTFGPRNRWGGLK